MKRNIYVASSWRNLYQPGVVESCREWGHDVYDFRNPVTSTAFHWSDIDPLWQAWTPQAYREALNHPLAQAGFRSDFEGMLHCNTCVLVMPAGRSACFELGWMLGAAKNCFIYLPEPIEPELMFRNVPILVTLEELHQALG